MYIENSQKIEGSTCLINSICTLIFDDEIGQIIDNIYPENSINSLLLKSIASNGIPETNSLMFEEETIYIFNLQKNPQLEFKNQLINQKDYYFCYTIFNQKKTTLSKRGYIQRSLVLLTEHNFGDIYLKLMSELGKFYFDDELESDKRTKIQLIYREFENKINKSSVINEIILSISLFKDKLGKSNLSKTMNQPRKDEILEETTNDSSTGSREEQQSAKYQFIDYDEVYPNNNMFIENLSLYYVSKLWIIWEILIQEIPILISSESPSQSSNLALLLSTLIHPLKYLGDCRPYMTIYDNEFKDYKEIEELKYLNSSIIGVINPFILKNFNNWPVILHYEDAFFEKSKSSNQNVWNPTKITLNSKDELKKLKEFKNLIEIDQKKVNTCIKTNKSVIETIFRIIETEGESGKEKANLYIRMHFQELTNDFLKTLDEFFFVYDLERLRKLVMLKKDNLSIFEIFNQKNFTKYLNEENILFNMKYINDKKKLTFLYIKFCESRKFNDYLSSVILKLKKMYLI